MVVCKLIAGCLLFPLIEYLLVVRSFLLLFFSPITCFTRAMFSILRLGITGLTHHKQGYIIGYGHH